MDVSGSLLALGKISTSIIYIRELCQVTDTPPQKATCSAAVNSLISSLGFFAAFTAASASDCAATMNAPALCASSAASVVTALSILAQSCSRFALTCGTASMQLPTHAAAAAASLLAGNSVPGAPLPQLPPGLSAAAATKAHRASIPVPQPGLGGAAAALHGPSLPDLSPGDASKHFKSWRRLADAVFNATDVEEASRELLRSSGSNASMAHLKGMHPMAVLPSEALQAKESLVRLRGAKLADCVLNANLAVTFTIRVALSISLATKKCPSHATDASAPTTEEKLLCSVLISNALTYFGLAGGLLASLASLCPEIELPNAKAECAADVLAMFGAVAAFFDVEGALVLFCK